MSLTVELWPDGVGELYGLTPSTGAGWQCLDDLSETDYVNIVNNNDLYQCSFYSLQNVSLPANVIIENLRLDGRANRLYSWTGNYNGYGKLSLKIGASYYSSGWTIIPNISPKTDFYYDWSVNPATGAAWTQSVINSLLVGMYLRCETGASDHETRAYWLRCTVTYRIPGCPRAQIIGLW